YLLTKQNPRRSAVSTQTYRLPTPNAQLPLAGLGRWKFGIGSSLEERQRVDRRRCSTREPERSSRQQVIPTAEAFAGSGQLGQRGPIQDRQTHRRQDDHVHGRGEALARVRQLLDAVAPIDGHLPVVHPLDAFGMKASARVDVLL